MLIVCVDMFSEEVVIGGAVDMLPDTDIIAVDTPTITLEFVVEVAYAGDVLTGVGLAAAMTSLELTFMSTFTTNMPNIHSASDF